MSILKKILCFILCTSLLLSEVAYCNAASATDTTYASITVHTLDGKGNELTKQDGYSELSDITICDEDGNISVDRENLGDSIKVRGFTSSQAPKKPFKIKFTNKVSVLGMPKNKSWCLLANCYDPTLLRNYIAFRIGQDMGLMVPDFRLVELILDDVYKGCYLLTQTVENVANIDVDKGEFLIEYEYERVEDGKEYLASDGLRFVVGDPDFDDLENPEFKYGNQSYKEYIQSTLDKLTGILNSGNYQKVKDNFDVDSLAKMYLLNEYYKNADVGYSSVFYIYRDGKLTAGPLWDFDLSSGNARDESYFDKNYKSYNTIYANVQLFARLLEYPEFKSLVNKYYHQYSNVFANYYKSNGIIDETVEKYSDLFEKNFSSDGAGWDISQEYSVFMRMPDETYNENLNFFKKWLKRRNEYLFLYSLRYSINNLKNEIFGS